MGLRSLLESWVIRGRVKQSSSVARSYDDLNTQELLEIVREVREIATDRKGKISEYKEMLTDGITRSAVELIAEDATQYDPDRKATVWVSCPSDREFEAKMNAFLQDVVQVETLAFSIAFQVVAFGDAYLNTFYSDEEYKKVGTVGDYFELEDPDYVSHVYRFGVPSGYFVGEDNRNSSREVYETILDEKDFIHFISDSGLSREKVDINTPAPNGEIVSKTYTVRYGTSFLEAARSYYKIMMLINDVLLISRLSRSQFYRLFGVEVGTSDSVETVKIVKDIRDAVSNKQNLNIRDRESGRLQTYSSPLSTGGNVYFPVRNGKGSVTVQTTGGDVDVRSILDVDYFDDKYYGALKVPKQFLGQSEDMPGGLGDTTLTRLDIRYARTVGRVQKVLREGFTKLILWKCSQDDVLPPEFSVELSKVTTAADDEKAASIEAQMSKLDRVLQLARDMGDEVDYHKIISYIIKEVYGDEGLGKLFLGEDNERDENPSSVQEDV